MDASFWWALGAIAGGLLLYLIEVSNPGFFLAVPGTVLIGIGMLTLAYPPLVTTYWAFITIPALAGIGTWGTVQGYKRLAPPADKPDTLSIDSIIGEPGRVKQAIPPQGKGIVKVRGQDWRAVAHGPIPVGTEVVVTAIDGFTVTVEVM